MFASLTVLPFSSRFPRATPRSRWAFLGSSNLLVKLRRRGPLAPLPVLRRQKRPDGDLNSGPWLRKPRVTTFRDPVVKCRTRDLLPDVRCQPTVTVHRKDQEYINPYVPGCGDRYAWQDTLYTTGTLTVPASSTQQFCSAKGSKSECVSHFVK